MERLSFANKRIIFIFAALFITAIVCCMTPLSIIKFHHIPAFCYITMILIWASSIRRRIADGKIRHRILAACMFMVFLFFLRMCKFSYFPYDDDINEYLWYGYSVPLTAIPVLMFTAALYVEPVKNEKLVDIIEKILIVISVVFMIFALTNRYHYLVYDITVHPDKDYKNGPFYWISLVFRIVLSICIMIILLKKCSLSSARKKWYIPVICIALSCVLVTWYIINGGSPKFMGHKLFHIHEAVCIPFIMAFESIIQIGLIPANSGYRHLFDNSGISACIYDNSNTPVLVSAQTPAESEDEDHKLRKEPISGGYITWCEDMSLINRLNHEIEEVTEELSDENDFIRKENEIRAERISYEERNRLYNKIASAVRTRAIRANSLLTEASDKNASPEDIREKIIYASVLSAYIKRMGNLMLLTDKTRFLSSGELCASIRESLDYMKLNGCSCFIYENSDCELNSDAVLLAYELFENAVEDVWLRVHALSVTFEYFDTFEMIITMDASAEAISSVWKDKKVSQAGCALSVKYEDDTYFIKFRFPESCKESPEKEAIV